ncbi:hypothetical protein [Spirillospora sp. NPDC047279]|uniref:hypothetical protein n=1 Tax=Spirillospora sp. NPDC047279 TaxID=3155478 RepID=UPI003405B925
MKKRILIGACGAALAVTACVVPTASAQAAEQQRARWSDTGARFYWHSSCKEAGKAGVRNEGWEAWDCKGSSAPWEEYELWKLD